MQITLKQAELESAVRDYITKIGIARPVGEVNFTPTRGNEGIVTSVEVGEASNVTLAVNTPAPVAEEAQPEVAQEAATEAAEEEDEMPEGTRLFG